MPEQATVPAPKESSTADDDSEDCLAFEGFPEPSLLETTNADELPIATLARLAKREGQSTRPIYRIHRWFARRLGSQFRGILSALTLGREASEDDFWKQYLGHISLSGARVLDPFMGGGTNLVESARCGADVAGRDIDPVAASIASAALSAGTAGKRFGGTPKEEAQRITADVRERITALHQTEVEGRTRRVLHHFWTQVVGCEACGEEVELHPHYRLAYDRKENVQWAFCSGCHQIQKISRDRKRLHCKTCQKYTRIEDGTHYWNTVTCPRCSHEQDLVPQDERRKEPPRWKLFAQEYLAGPGKRPDRRFKRAEPEDRALVERSRCELHTLRQEGERFVPDRVVPDPPGGRLDQRPLIHGVSRYEHLFNDRQLLHLSLLGRRIASLDDPLAKRLFGLAFSEHLTTNCMYTGYAFGYRRTSPLFSFHGYRHIVRPVEINPWLDGIGRGTFPNALRKTRRASDFALAPYDYAPDGEKNESDQVLRCVLSRDGFEEDLPRGEENEEEPVTEEESISVANVRATSSTDLSDLADASFDLVLTDPPYFDNVGYSELSDFYLAWHQALGIATGPYEDPRSTAPLTENLAVAGGSGEEEAQSYERDLGKVFGEVERVLKPDAPCVFTYHHTSARAWLALARALGASGLKCTAVLPMRGEGQGGLHSYEGTIRWDAVFVMRKPKENGAKGQVREHLTHEGDLYVTAEDLEASSVRGKAMREKLAGEEVGYREPDEINFYRAQVIMRALVRLSGGRSPQLDAKTHESAISLSDALSSYLSSGAASARDVAPEGQSA